MATNINTSKFVGIGFRGIVAPATSPYDPDAQAFITATGISGTNATAINDLVLDLKAASIWTKFNALYPIIGGTATTHKYNLKNPLDTDAAFRLAFATGWTHSNLGMTGNGSSSYANTFLIPNSVLSLNSSHISAYTRSNILIDAPLLSSDNATTYANGLYIWAKQTGAPNNSSVRINDNTSDGVPAPADIRGLHLATRTASNVKKYRLNNTQQFSVTSSSTSLNTSSIYIGASRNNPNYNSSQIAFSSIGSGLTDTESQVFYQIVEKYQVALGRNINPTQSFYYNRNYNNETNAFLFATQITDTTQQTAVNTLVNDFKSAGIWTKMKAVYPIVGGTAATHKFNLVNPQDTNAAFRLAFSTGWTHSSTGMTPNGTSAYADSYFVASSNLTLFNSHQSFYSRTSAFVNAGVSQAGFFWGVAANTGYWTGLDYWGLSINNNTKQIGAIQNSSAAAGDYAISPVLTNKLGFWMNNRTSATPTTLKVWRNGLAIANATTSSAGQSLTIRNTTLSCINNGTNFPAYVQWFDNSQCSFASLGTGLTDLEAQLFYQIVEKYQVALSRNINPTLPFYYSTDYNPETNAFLFNTGITDATTISATDTLVTTLKSQGIWTKMKAVYPIVGGTAATHKFNLVNPVDTNDAFRLTFSTGWTHSSTGMTPNGAAYADTFFNTNAYRNNNHLTYYIRTNVNETSVDAGVYVNILGGEYFDIESRISNVAYYGNHTTATAISYANTDSRGFHINTRTASNLFKVYLNSTLKGTNTSPTSTAINLNMYLGCRNTSGSPATYSTKQCSFSSIGDGLTDTEAANFYTAVQAFQTTLGRQV